MAPASDAPANELVLDFDPLHTLGFLISDWVTAHCSVPGGVFEGRPFEFNGWQLEVTVNHYRIKPGAVADDLKPLLPFHYRRSVVVAPQKAGKSPWGAAIALAECVGPTQFAGWAEDGDEYRCADHGCSCGWSYEYLPGEAMGKPRPGKSQFGLLAFAESQVQNVYEPMQSMVVNGPLAEIVKVGEGFMRTPKRGKIQPLTSASRTQLGKPFTGAIADETGLYTKQNKVLDVWQTIRRAVAAMNGRTIELTNAWDPMENSAAQQAFESPSEDVYRYFRKPPADLDYRKPKDRQKIHDYVYAGAPWVDTVNGIGPEAAELCQTDPTQAERFYGNRLVQGLGSFMTEALWESGVAPEPSDKTTITLGFDGSKSGDWTAIRAETHDGFRFTPTYGPDDRPTVWNPDEWGGKIPRGEVQAAVKELFEKYRVERFYADDDPTWATQIDEWASEHGDDTVIGFPTRSLTRMYPALDRYKSDLEEGVTTHSDCTIARTHALNARKVAKPGDKYLLGKPSQHQKIDVLMADVLAHEAAADARAAGWSAERAPTFFRLPR